jgi:hypothetical protein
MAGQTLMAIMLEKLYDALIAAHVPDEKARAAAVEGADYENRLADIETRLMMLTWVVGMHFAVTLGGFGLMFNQLLSISAKLP